MDASEQLWLAEGDLSRMAATPCLLVPTGTAKAKEGVLFFLHPLAPASLTAGPLQMLVGCLAALLAISLNSSAITGFGFRSELVYGSAQIWCALGVTVIRDRRTQFNEQGLWFQPDLCFTDGFIVSGKLPCHLDPRFFKSDNARISGAGVVADKHVKRSHILHG